MVAPALVAVGQATMTAAPMVLDRAKKVWNVATGGKVDSVASAVEFANKNIANASVVAQGLVAAGMHPDAVLPLAAITNPSAARLKESLMGYALARQKVTDAITPGGGTQGPSNAASDIFFIRIGRAAVSAVGNVSKLRALQQVLLTWKDDDFDRFEALMKEMRG